MTSATDLENLCSGLLKTDKSIRFAGKANKMGRLISARFREGLQPLLTREEREGNVMKATLRMKTREDYESKRGKSFTLLPCTRK